MSESFEWSSAHQYYRFMELSQDELRERQRFYLQWFRGAKLICDIGCGTGIFLEEARGSGIEGIGVDVDPALVEACRRKGLRAETGEATEFLNRHTDTFDGIFCSHLVEHLDPEKVAELASSCHRALASSGVVVFITPNPEALHVHLREFWRDPTHVRPYSVEALSFLISSAGFRIEAAEDNPNHSTGRVLIDNALRTGHWYSRLLLRPVLHRIHIAMRAAGLDRGNEIFVVGRK